MHNQFGVYGASGHTKVILEILENSGNTITCLYDDDPDKKSLLGYAISNDQSVLQTKDMEWIIGVGNNSTRKKIAENNFLNYGKAIDDSAQISKRAQIGPGTVVMPGAVINSDTVIGIHTIINSGATVDHDCNLSDYVHISPQAALAGNVKVGEGTHIGIGACIIQGITIGKWVTVGAGAVIIKDIPDYAVVVGNPGKIIKYNRQ